MPRPKKIRRYSSVYSKRRRTKQVAIRVALGVTAFVLIAALVYAIAVGVTYLNSRPETVPESSVSVSEQSPSSEMSSEPEAQSASIQAEEMPTSTVQSLSSVTAFVTQAKADGCNAVVVPLKTSDGVLLYASQVPEASSWSAVSPSPVDVQAIVNAITSAGLTPIAEMEAFKDGTAPHAKRDNSYYHASDPTTTYLFSGSRWLNPYEDAARQYICDLATEIASFGFEQVLLDDVQFPPQELTSKVGTDANGVTKQDILKQFISELNATGVSTIVSYNWDAIGGGEQAELLYGGDPALCGAQTLSPIIDITEPPAGVTGSPQDMVTAAMEQVRQTAGEDTPIVPQIVSGGDVSAIEAGLQAAGVDSYILQSAD